MWGKGQVLSLFFPFFFMKSFKFLFLHSHFYHLGLGLGTSIRGQCNIITGFPDYGFTLPLKDIEFLAWISRPTLVCMAWVPLQNVLSHLSSSSLLVYSFFLPLRPCSHQAQGRECSFRPPCLPSATFPWGRLSSHPCPNCPAVITSFPKQQKLRRKDSMGTFFRLVLSIVIQLSLWPVFLTVFSSLYIWTSINIRPYPYHGAGSCVERQIWVWMI